MNKNSLILDIGTYEMRLLQLNSAGEDGISLEKCFAVATPGEFLATSYFEEPILDERKVADSVKSLMKSAKISSRDVLMLLPDTSCLMETLYLEGVYSSSEIDAKIRKSFEPALQIPYERWYCSKVLTGSFNNFEIYAVMLVLRKNITEIGGIVQKTGLNPICADVAILNVANLLKGRLSQSNEKNTALIHLGNESSSVAIFKGSTLRFLSNRPVGACDFTLAVKAHFKLSFSEAEDFKRKEVFFLPEYTEEQELNNNFKIVKDVAITLCEELFATFESYFNTFRENTIDEIILSGGGANFENLDALLRTNLNAETFQIGELYKLYAYGKELSQADKNVLAAASGACLRGGS